MINIISALSIKTIINNRIFSDVFLFLFLIINIDLMFIRIIKINMIIKIAIISIIKMIIKINIKIKTLNMIIKTINTTIKIKINFQTSTHYNRQRTNFKSSSILILRRSLSTIHQTNQIRLINVNHFNSNLIKVTIIKILKTTIFKIERITLNVLINLNWRIKSTWRMNQKYHRRILTKNRDIIMRIMTKTKKKNLMKNFWNYDDYEINFVTSITMISIIHTCQRCNIKFIFKNKLFKHFRSMCWKTKNNNHAIIINDINVNKINDINEIDNFNSVFEINSKSRRFIKFIDKSILKNDYIFRDFHYVTTLIKKSHNEKTKNCCLNIDCSLSIEKRIYVKKIFSTIEVKQFVISLSIWEIKNIIHKFNEYIIADVFMNDYIEQNDKQLSIIDKFSMKIHIIDDLKINLLLNNDVFSAQRVSININIQIVTLISCNNLIISINIMIKKTLIKNAQWKLKLISTCWLKLQWKFRFFLWQFIWKQRFFLRITMSTIIWSWKWRFCSHRWRRYKSCHDTQY